VHGEPLNIEDESGATVCRLRHGVRCAR
jgi:hypothetical protein